MSRSDLCFSDIFDVHSPGLLRLRAKFRKCILLLIPLHAPPTPENTAWFENDF